MHIYESEIGRIVDHPWRAGIAPVCDGNILEGAVRKSTDIGCRHVGEFDIQECLKRLNEKFTW